MKENGEKVKKKILFVAPNLHHGGAEAVLVKILNNIDLNEFEVRLVLVKKEGNHLSKLHQDMNIIDLNSSSAINSIWKLKNVIKVEKPDYVFSIIGHINLILSALKFLYFKNIKFIGRENVVYSEWLYKDLSKKKILLSIFYKLFLKNLDIVLVQSKYMKEQVSRFFKVPLNKIVLLNNPIEIRKIALLKEDSDLSKMWNFQRVNLIAVGRIEQVKNYTEMIKILLLLPEKFHLNIFGDGSEREKLEEFIKKNGLNNRVTIYGFVENPYKYMKNSFALLLTSTRESFPNVVLEANACGIFVVSYDMPGGISEIITNGSNGYVIQEGNKVEFANKLISLHNNGYNSENIIRHSERYSIDEYMHKIYKLLKDNQ